jgi:hypothetical protein
MLLPLSSELEEAFSNGLEQIRADRNLFPIHRIART